MHKLSVVIITRNAEELLDRCLASVNRIADEIVAVDAASTDATRSILADHHARIIRTHSNHLGRNKAIAIRQARHNLILLIDSDEIVSKRLHDSIMRLKRRKQLAGAYRIRFHNHFLGRRVRYGGEGYQMIRLIQKQRTHMYASPVHEHVTAPETQVRSIAGHIDHYSYRSIQQMLRKFTIYALLESRMKYRAGERSSLRKIVLYPIHMFWARFILDHGYKDGIRRLPLDLGFAYMEWLTYTSLALRTFR